jgi:hypothetical protein
LRAKPGDASRASTQCSPKINLRSPAELDLEPEPLHYWCGFKRSDSTGTFSEQQKRTAGNG